MKRMQSFVFAGLLALGTALPAAAHQVVYTGTLLGSSEVPAADTTGHGIARVTIDLDLLMMRVQASFADLIGNVSASHIHCCTNPGTNVGVATMTPTFIGFPSGVKAGSYDHTFDMALAGSYNAPFITNNGGTVGSAFNALVAGLDAGRAYLNIHTNAFPGGEIRALLAPVPVPGAVLMFAPALGALALGARRRTRAPRRAA